VFYFRRILTGPCAQISCPCMFTHSHTSAGTPLILAVSNHQHAVVKAMLERGADVNERTAFNETALIRCLSSATKETASMDAAILQ